MITRRNLIQSGLASLAGTGLTPPSLVHAQAAMPEIARILIGVPPGGGADRLARTLAEKLSGSHAARVVVENKPGAAGQLAITAARDSVGDGSVLLLTISSALANSSRPNSASYNFSPWRVPITFT